MGHSIDLKFGLSEAIAKVRTANNCIPGAGLNQLAKSPIGCGVKFNLKKSL